MGNHPRKADGRRVYSAEFKRTTVQRILTGEKTVAELSRELDIVPSVIRRWARRSEAGAPPPRWRPMRTSPTERLVCRAPGKGAATRGLVRKRPRPATTCRALSAAASNS
jgi:transposase-like protein